MRQHSVKYLPYPLKDFLHDFVGHPIMAVLIAVGLEDTAYHIHENWF